MPPNLLILPLLAGFLFIHKCQFFAFRSSKLESERLLLESAVFGVIFAGAARVIADVLYAYPAGKWLSSALQYYGNFEYMGTALGSLILGYSCAIAVNTIARLSFGSAWLKFYVVRTYDNGLLRMLFAAMDNERPVFVTLASRKVYVGYLIEAPTRHNDQYFTLTLLLSGYRHEQTLEFIETENYADKAITTTDLENFTMTLPLSEVTSAFVFDRNRYERLFAPRARSERRVLEA